MGLELRSLAEAAALRGVSVRQLQRWCDQRSLRYYVVSHRRMVDLADLDRRLSQCVREVAS